MALGLSAIQFHRNDPAVSDALAFGSRGASRPDMNLMSAEQAAHLYLKRALVGEVRAASRSGGEQADFDAADKFKPIGSDKVPFLQSTLVKFRQHRNRVPVYGSLVTVEVDEGNDFVSLRAQTGRPEDVDPIARISAATALARNLGEARPGEPSPHTPGELQYYFDPSQGRWRLVFLFKNILRPPDVSRSDQTLSRSLSIADYVVDAHTGELVDVLPRSCHVDVEDFAEDALDDLGVLRSISAVRVVGESQKSLINRNLNVVTHDFGFRDISLDQLALPGDIATDQAGNWDSGAVSAHANSERVVRFLRDILGRNGLDNLGGPVVSSTNCVFLVPAGSREWHNAARGFGQMLYGQKSINGRLRSYAASLDVVAHELIHGVNEHSADIQYKFESGALNESLSDIFGVIISNGVDTPVENWNWEIGEDLTADALPMRDMADPTRRNQPDHMRDFVVLPDSTDHGGVHTNSGIHNRAAHLMLTAKQDNGHPVFSPIDVARLFYVCLNSYLASSSKFADCRAAMELIVQSFVTDTQARNRMLHAIQVSYDAVGISVDLTA